MKTPPKATKKHAPDAQHASPKLGAALRSALGALSEDAASRASRAPQRAAPRDTPVKLVEDAELSAEELLLIYATVPPELDTENMPPILTTLGVLDDTIIPTLPTDHEVLFLPKAWMVRCTRAVPTAMAMASHNFLIQLAEPGREHFYVLPVDNLERRPITYKALADEFAFTKTPGSLEVVHGYDPTVPAGADSGMHFVKWETVTRESIHEIRANVRERFKTHFGKFEVGGELLRKDQLGIRISITAGTKQVLDHALGMVRKDIDPDARAGEQNGSFCVVSKRNREVAIFLAEKLKYHVMLGENTAQPVYPTNDKIAVDDETMMRLVHAVLRRMEYADYYFSPTSDAASTLINVIFDLDDLDQHYHLEHRLHVVGLLDNICEPIVVPGGKSIRSMARISTKAVHTRAPATPEKEGEAIAPAGAPEKEGEAIIAPATREQSTRGKKKRRKAAAATPMAKHAQLLRRHVLDARAAAMRVETQAAQFANSQLLKAIVLRWRVTTCASVHQQVACYEYRTLTCTLRKWVAHARRLRSYGYRRDQMLRIRRWYAFRHWRRLQVLTRIRQTRRERMAGLIATGYRAHVHRIHLAQLRPAMAAWRDLLVQTRLARLRLKTVFLPRFAAYRARMERIRALPKVGPARVDAVLAFWHARVLKTMVESPDGSLHCLQSMDAVTAGVISASHALEIDRRHAFLGQMALVHGILRA